jgi:hypothetical protein
MSQTKELCCNCGLGVFKDNKDKTVGDCANMGCVHPEQPKKEVTSCDTCELWEPCKVEG